MMKRIFTCILVLSLTVFLVACASGKSDKSLDTQEIDVITINNKEYYLIANETQLLALESYGLDKNYMQQNDIEISNEEWMPIGTSNTPFTGSYNGNGFKITGLTDKTPVTTLFGNANNAKLYNITFENNRNEDFDREAKDFVCEYAEECQIYDIFYEQ